MQPLSPAPPMPVCTTLEDTFRYMKACTERGVPGILRIKGKKKGKSVQLMTALTHGCEVTGLAAFRHILNHREEIEKKLEGELLLIINNIRAAENFFTKPLHESAVLWHWCDTNMNRLPKEVLSGNSVAYEIQRFKELYPWYQEATAALDIHSLPKKGIPMVIDIKGPKGKLDLLAGHIPVPVRIQNVVKIQRGVPVGYFYGGKNSAVIEIEVGKHLEKRAGLVAIESAMHFLFPGKKHTQKIFEVFKALCFPDISYRLPKLFANYERVRKGQLLATNKTESILASEDCITLFTRTKKFYTDPVNLETEILFLARKKRSKPK